MRRFLGAASLTVALSVAFSIGTPVQAGGFVASDETHVQNMVNATRQSKDLPTLSRNDHLVAMARAQSVRQAEKGSIFHNTDLGGDITRRGLDWLKVGENVGMGPSVDMIEEAFLKSPHHYENIVDAKFDSIGVGVVDGADGRSYVTQVFADLRSGPSQGTSAKPTVPAPAVQAPQPTARPAPVTATSPARPSAVAPEAERQPKEAGQPSHEPAIHPNVVVGGAIEPADLAIPRSDQAKRPGASFEAGDGGPLSRIVDVVTFWS